MTLPFKEDPVPRLKGKHKGSDNFHSAKQVYRQQCRKSDVTKDKMRIVHKELVDKKFMVRIRDLPNDKRKFIESAPFRHYYPWRMVERVDSVSTPLRMVVDPTMTGLNSLLAKGENRLGNINRILIYNRVQKYSWSSDISKMYNQLDLKEDALPYSLFLYDESLDPEIEPEVWVMVVAWYGVVPTGNQAGFAIETLARSRT